MSGTYPLPFTFVLVFLLFSVIFFHNTYKLWFKTDQYYNDIRNSLTRSPSIYPFSGFFLRWMQNRRRWELVQKIFSIIGLGAVLAADALVISAWLAGRS
jgi:hypothetical protein